MLDLAVPAAPDPFDLPTPPIRLWVPPPCWPRSPVLTTLRLTPSYARPDVSDVSHNAIGNQVQFTLWDNST